MYDDKVVMLFRLGLSYSEILQCLANIYGIVLSTRSLKRMLKSAQLYRRVHYTDILDVALFIIDEVQQSGSLCGYKMMHLKCIQGGFVVTQETVRQLLHMIDPEGVCIRTRHRLRRRLYANLGPNYLWHMDSYDKLKPYGICINGAIDGYSRYVVWLQANRTSSDPKVVAGYFIDVVQKVKACPLRMRADKGTENGHVKQMLMFLRRNGQDQYSSNCFLEGSSNHNQRIEQWWGFLRKQNAQFWMNFFEMLKDMGLFDGGFVDKSLIQFTFLRLIQDELDSVVTLWNNHRIRPTRNSTVPSGRPMVLYNCPQLYGTQSYACAVTDAEVNVCLGECTPKGPLPCDETIFELCSSFMVEYSLRDPKCAEEAALLYQFLRNKILAGLA